MKEIMIAAAVVLVGSIGFTVTVLLIAWHLGIGVY
jgi:hypothetical protein